LDAVSRADVARRAPVPDLNFLDLAAHEVRQLESKTDELDLAIRDCRNRRAAAVAAGNSALGAFEYLITRINQQIAAVRTAIDMVLERRCQKKKLKDEWQAEHDNLHSTTDVCPTCGQEIRDA